jgi:predicted ribosomally synthesized peptide with SipW-like signal peptide
MKNKTKVLLSSLAVIAVSSSLVTGATYALFTSEDVVNIAVTSGKVKILADVDENSMEMWSRDVKNLQGAWVNGGTADLQAKQVDLFLITPGDGISFNINVTNESNVAIQYRTVVSCISGMELYEGLKVSFDYVNDKQADVQEFDGVTAYGAWTLLEGGVNTVETVKVTIEFPYLDTDQNQYQDLATSISFRVEAVQGNADLPTNP